MVLIVLRRTRLRWADWIGIVGVGILLVWTPSYLAQNPGERTLTWGETFTLPTSRDGDRAVLDLVVTHADRRVARYANVAEFVFDTQPIPEASLVGVATVGRFAIIYHEANISLPFAAYVSPESSRSWWVDEHGSLAWQSQENVHQWGRNLPIDPDDVAAYGTRPTACPSGGPPSDFIGKVIRYEPDAAGSLIAELRSSLRDAPMNDPCGGARGAGSSGVVNRAYESEAGALYGRHTLRADRIFDKVTQKQTDPFETCNQQDGQPVFGRYNDGPYLGPHHGFAIHFDDVFRYTTELRSRCDHRDHYERWDWFSPDFPVPVGQHARHHDAEGNLLFHVDLVPSRIERGEGASISFIPRPDASGFPYTVEPGPARAATLTLADIEHEQSIRLLNRTLGDAAAIVRARADGALGEFLAKGTHVVAFTAATNESPAPHAERASVWTLTFARQDGSVRTAVLNATWSAPPAPVTSQGPLLAGDGGSSLQPGAGWNYEVADACAVDPSRGGPSRALGVAGPRYCGAVDPSRVAPTRALVAFDELLDDLDAFGTNGHGTLRDPEPDTFSRISMDVIDATTVARLGTSGSTPGEQRARTQEPRSALSWQVGHHDDRDDVAYEASGSHDPETGVAWFVARGSTPGAGDPSNASFPATRPSGDAFHLLPVTPLAATTFWSGLFLLVMAGILRGVAAFKSGSFPTFAAALYAKIRRKDVLLNERREAITEALRAEPGLTATELAKRIDAGWGAMAHHLDMLGRSGLVARVTVGRKNHLFLAEETTPRERRLLALRRDPAYAAFLDAVASDPGRSLDEIAAILPRSMSGLSRTGSLLASEGVVEKRRDGGTVRFYPASAADGDGRA